MVGTPFKLVIQDLRDIAEIGQHCGDGGGLGFAQCAIDAHATDSHPDRVATAQEATGARKRSAGERVFCESTMLARSQLCT